MPKLLKKVDQQSNAAAPSNGDGQVANVIDRIAPELMPLAKDIGLFVYDPDNARLHPERNKEAIRWSLSTYGQQKPIVVRAATMHVVAGNGTLEAARELGWTRIAASVVEMTEEEAAGYGVVDNRSAELAMWNYEVLARLTVLKGMPPPMYTDEEIRLLSANRSDPSWGEGGVSAEEAWQGMPEFVQEDQTSWRHVVVHLRCEEDLARFLMLMEQSPGNIRQNSIWYPKAEIGRFADKRYISKDGAP